MNEVIILRSRMHPFKTKFTQAFNINWGDEKYEEAQFVERERRPIQIFKIQEFVNLIMKSKMNNKMNSKGPGGGIPLGQMGGMGGGNPFAQLMAGGIPGGMPSGIGQPRPQSSGPASFADVIRNQNSMGPERPEQPRPQGINIEELMKKIDAKIAELEAEEEAEKQANENNKLNPLINNKEEAKDLPSVPKDDIEIPEDKKLPASNVASFSDIIANAKAGDPEREVPKFEPRPMVTNPLDTETKAPVYPSEPIINKPLTGIIDPTKQMTYESFGQVQAETVKPVEKPAPVEVKETPKENPYDYVSDDEFFDDFFDEE
jgi:hypothetical protein